VSQSTKAVTSNLPHASLAVALTFGLILAAVIPAASQTQTFSDPVETDYAPYNLGQAGGDISTAFDVRTEPQGQFTKTDTIKFHVGGLVENYGQAEYKLTLKPGQTVQYSWTASDEIYYEFHGHYMIDSNTPGDAVLYRNAKASASHGSITAPIEGWHGWYFVNDSFETPIDIELTIWGDYELTPGVINTRE
jgi:hypothetical protein